MDKPKDWNEFVAYKLDEIAEQFNNYRKQTNDNLIILQDAIEEIQEQLMRNK